MRAVLELLRIMFIFLILLAILGTLLETIYVAIGNGAEQYRWLNFMAIFLFTFVMYRNKLQFSGWYEGEGKHKLPTKISQLLLIVVAILILLPPILAQML